MTNHNRLLELALKGLEVERHRIAEEIADIQTQLGNGSRRKTAPPPAQAASIPRKRRITAAGRKAISEAMKKRWAERRKTMAKS